MNTKQANITHQQLGVPSNVRVQHYNTATERTIRPVFTQKKKKLGTALNKMSKVPTHYVIINNKNAQFAQKSW
jgi:hypothetical protein